MAATMAVGMVATLDELWADKTVAAMVAAMVDLWEP